ncbi:hypothetical protein DFQ30_008860, partial [Apophysomyces sp. BC1015]
YYPESETEAAYEMEIELAYEYGEITNLTDFDVFVHDIQMKENFEEYLEDIITELKVVSISDN